MNGQLLILGLLSAALATQIDIASLDGGIDESKLFCNQPLLQAYGLIGSATPSDTKLPMCPSVVKSCCLYSDQITIYEQWVHREELKRIEERFAYHLSIYGAVIDAAVRVQDNANTVFKRLKAQRISNCKVLAKRIIHFEFKDIALRLKNALDEMHKFFIASYSGFYCALCDATNHQFFKTESNQIVYSKMFCRDITEKSLNVLLYFHSHMLRFSNLLLKFTTYCDSNGFFAKKPISNDDLFYVIGSDKKSLERCRDYRNSKTWFDECGFICDSFQINSYDFMFEPHLKQFKTFAKILKDAESTFEKPDVGDASGDHLEDDEKTAGIPDVGHGRKLGEITEKDVLSSANPFPSQKVIMSSDDSPYSLDKYDNVFENEGISLSRIGQLAEVNKLKFEEVTATMIRLAQLKKSVWRTTVFLGSLLLIVI